MRSTSLLLFIIFISFCCIGKTEAFIDLLTDKPNFTQPLLKTKKSLTNASLICVLPPTTIAQSLKIVDSQFSTLNVINQGSTISLKVVDDLNQEISDISFDSDNSNVISIINSKSGLISALNPGVSLIKASLSNGQTVSSFISVVKLSFSNASNLVTGSATDNSSFLYFSDPINHVIWKKAVKSPNSNPAIFAGNGIAGLSNGENLQAAFNTPTALVVDKRAIEGAVYVADTLNHSIRKISSGQVYSILGTGTLGIPIFPSSGIIGDNQLDKVSLNSPKGLALSESGLLFIADTLNHAIYSLDLTRKQLHLLAGTPSSMGLKDGKANLAQFSYPSSLSLSNDGKTLAVADTGNNKIRFINIISKEVTTLEQITLNFHNSIETNVFDETNDLAYDFLNNLYIIDSTGIHLLKLNGRPKPSFSQIAAPSSFSRPTSVSIVGNQIYVFDAASQKEQTLKIVSSIAPKINSLSLELVSLPYNDNISIIGENFNQDTQLILAKLQVRDLKVESSTKLQFKLPKELSIGSTTLSLRTSSGIAQKQFTILPKPISQLQTGEISVLAGSQPYIGDGASIESKLISLSPNAIAIDSHSNLFFIDINNSTIRKIEASSGIISTIAGSNQKDSLGDGGLAINASFTIPSSIAIDSQNNIFVADAGNSRIRKIDASTAIISTIAGNGKFEFSGDGGLAINAGLDFPKAITIAEGNLFIADTFNNCIRKVNLDTGIISTVAGNGKFEFSGDGGLAINASLKFPTSLVVDKFSNLFIADSGNNRVRKVESTKNTINTVAGNGLEKFVTDGVLATATSIAVFNISLDHSNNLFIADVLNNRIRKVDALTGLITTIAGNGKTIFSGEGALATEASLSPLALTIDIAGTIFIADTTNNRLNKIDPITGIISTLIGGLSNDSIGDGQIAFAAQLNFPKSVIVDSQNNIFIADAGNSRVRKIDATTTIISTIAGNGNLEFSGDGGLAINAGLFFPTSLAFDNNENLFIADSGNNRIRKIEASTGIISTVVGNGMKDFTGDGESAILAGLRLPVSLAFDKLNNLYFTDAGNARIRRVDASTTIITTITGNGTRAFRGDGEAASAAAISFAEGIFIDNKGNLFITDKFNNRIRKIDGQTTKINTIAGNGTAGFAGDGLLSTLAELNLPSTVVTDSNGNLFIADRRNNRIRRVDAKTNTITTIAGNGQEGFNGNTALATDASLSPESLAIDNFGNLLVTDEVNNQVYIIKSVASVNSSPGVGPERKVFVNKITFSRKDLTIEGSGFGSTNATVIINGENISSFISQQTDAIISLKGNSKKLKLKSGKNIVTVFSGGITTNPFVFDRSPKKDNYYLVEH